MQKSKNYLYLEIAESLRRRIASGELEPGDKLTPVREMAQRWNCTPGTVSRAYAQLAQEGLITGHPTVLQYRPLGVRDLSGTPERCPLHPRQQQLFQEVLSLA